MLSRRPFFQTFLSLAVAVPAWSAGGGVHCDVAVIGGGTGGCAAALAAVRNGMRVVMTEETPWIGGQLTLQAVPHRIDLHPSSMDDNSIEVGSLPFQISLGALISRRMENLLAAAKNLGSRTSQMAVTGCTLWNGI